MSGRSPTDALSSVQVALNRVVLPPKKYFKIGEVAHLVGVEPHVLRYWQTQFPQVRPQKSRSGHRLYRRRDVETLLAVKELLHVQRFTIAGARQALRMAMVQSGTPSELPSFVDSTPPTHSAGPESAYDDAFDDGLDDEDSASSDENGAEPDVTELELIARDGAALTEALADQWAERHLARGGVEIVDVVADDVAPTEHAASSGPANGDASAPLAHDRASQNGQGRAVSVDALGAKDPAVAVVARAPGEPTSLAREPRARIAVVVEDDDRGAPLLERAPQRAPELAHERRAQLGFGFSAGARAVLLEAREELRQSLSTLDGYAAERRRHTSGRR